MADLIVQDATHEHLNTWDHGWFGEDGWFDYPGWFVDLVLTVTPTVQDGSHAHTADALNLQVLLAVASSSHVHSAEAPALGVHLLVAGAQHAHAATSPAMVVTPTVADAAHVHSAESPGLIVNLDVGDAAHAHTSETPSLAIWLSVADATHDHAGDTLHLAVWLVVAGAQHVHAATSPALVLTPAVADAIHGHSAETPSLIIHLGVNDTAHIHTSEVPGLVVWLAVADAIHSHAADALYLAVWLAVAGALHGHTAEAPYLGLHLAVANALHDHSAESPELALVLTPADTTHGHSAESLGLTVHLLVAAAAHSLSSDTPTLVLGLSVADAAHSHSIEALNLIVHLDVAAAAHSHGAENVDLSNVLTVADAAHIHAAGSPALGIPLVVADAGHTHSAEILHLGLHLAPADVSHSHAATGPTFTVTPTVQPGIHSQVADNVPLGTHLAVADATHSHGAGAPALFSVYAGSHGHAAQLLALGVHLVVADASHAHSATVPTLGLSLAPADGVHSHIAEAPGLQVHLAVAGGIHAHAADNIALGGTLEVGDCQHAHDAEAPHLGLHLLVAPAGHVHTADSPNLLSVFVQDAAHSHAATAPTLGLTLGVESPSHFHWAEGIQTMISGPNSYFLAEEAKASGAEVVYEITIGSYAVPQSDIIDPGELTTVRSLDFSEIASGDFTIILDTSHGKYSPRSADFILAGDVWYRTSVTVELGYRRPGTALVDKVTIFEGFITEWVVSEIKDYASDAPHDGLVAEITARDRLSLLAERRIGQPASDGEPSPSVFGKVFWDADSVEDRRLWDYSDAVVDFETGDFSQCTSVVQNGNGTVVIIEDDPYDGDYCARCLVDSKDDDAYVHKDFGGAEDYVLFTTYIKVAQMPTYPETGQIYLMGLQDSGGSDLVVLSPDQYGYVQCWTGEWEQTDWNIQDYMGQWHRVTIGYAKPLTGNEVLRIWVDNDEVYNKEAAFTYAAGKCWVGLRYNPSATYDETWELHLDKLLLDDEYYSQGVYLPGRPYESIDRVWTDGRVLTKQKVVSAPWRAWLQRYREWWQKYYSGRRYPWDNYDDYPAYGMVDFIDKSDPPSGGFMIEATKNSTTHPADIIKACLVEAGLGGELNEASFDAVKAADSDCTGGALFDDTSLAEAAIQVNQRALYDLYHSIDDGITLQRYTGGPLTSSVITVDRSNCHSFEQSFETSDIKTSVTARWGLQSKSTGFFYRIEDDDLMWLIGDTPIELDFSYGQEFMSDCADWIREKAELLMKRVHGATETVRVTGDLRLARVELGDGVLVANQSINDEDLIYECFEKSIVLSEKTVTLTLVRFNGEEVPWLATGQRLLHADGEYVLIDDTSFLLVN